MSGSSRRCCCCCASWISLTYASVWQFVIQCGNCGWRVTPTTGRGSFYTCVCACVCARRNYEIDIKPARCGPVSREEIKLIFMTITLIELSMRSILSTLLQFHLSIRHARKQSPSYALLAAASKTLFTTQSTRYSILWCRAVKQKTWK